MSEMLRGYSREPRSSRRGYRSQDVEIDPLSSSYAWNHRVDDDEEPVHFKTKEFYDFFDPEREFRAYGGFENGSSEMIDLGKAKVPAAGQIIWDDIGDNEAVDSLSWSQSDVEREIESWDQRLRESEMKPQRLAWDDGDMIRFEEPRDVYLPRRKTSLGSGYYDGRSARNGRTRRDGECVSLSRYEYQPEFYDRRDVKDGRYKEKGRRGRRAEGDVQVPKFESGRSLEVGVPPPPEDHFKPARTADGDCRCPCDHTYTSYKQEETALFPPDVAKPEVRFFHQQTSTPSSMSPSSEPFKAAD
ncbi:UNVERIFIED_CONTAM: hypothetical protein PYX00_006350 [Menopon gallinae]|uniref:Uncharacterized protein n=1 Tax=Menopon gallinae TaxID=328185 RepID=A0AAW2HUV3_9NEOP